MQHMPNGSKKGFTLIELILTITIISILSVVIITKFSFSPARLTTAKEKLASDIRYAQAMAVYYGARYGIEFFPNTNIYRLYEVVDGAQNILSDPADQSANYEVDYDTDKRFSGVDLVSVVLGGFTTLEFDWQGIPYTASAPLTSNGTVVIQNDSGSATITITPQTGRVSY